MNIAVDITPISGKEISGHKVRGVGMYIANLTQNLQRFDHKNKYTFFVKGDKLPTGIDIVHYPYFDPFFKTLPVIKKYKTVVTVHDLTPIVFKDHFPAGIRGAVHWSIQKILLKRVNHIITDSENSKKDILKILGIPEEKVSVVYLAADESFKVIDDKKILNDVREKYNLPENFLLYVGDVTWNKNLPRLVSVVKRLNVPMVMVGKALVSIDFDKTNEWNKDLVLVRKEIEGDKMFYPLGFLPTEELVALYNSAQALVMPSLYEGFGFPVLEAMQSGCPVVTSKGGSLAEVGGDAVSYIDPYDEDNMYEVIKKIFYDKKLQEDFKNKGIIQAKKFSWEKAIEQTIEAYRKTFGN